MKGKEVKYREGSKAGTENGHKLDGVKCGESEWDGGFEVEEGERDQSTSSH